MKRFSVTVTLNSVFGLAAQFAVKLFSFVFSVMVVRRLGAADFGQYAAVLAFAATFAVVSDLGLSPYAVRQVARWRDLPDGSQRVSNLMGNMIAIRLILAVLTTLLLLGAAWITRRPGIMVAAIALNAVSLFIYAVQGTSHAMLTGAERLGVLSAARVLQQFAFVLLGTVALLFGTGYFGLITANLLSLSLLAWVCWQAMRRTGIRPARPLPGDWMRLIRAGLPFGVIGFALGLSYKFDTVLLNVFRGDVETGYYNAAYNLVFSATTLSNAINLALYPSLTRQHVTSPHTMGQIYARAMRYLLVLGLPIAVGAWALAHQAVQFLYGASFLPAAPVLQLIIWAVPLMFVSEFLGYVVVINGQESHVARAVVTSTGFNIALNLLLVPRFGLQAAAVMTVLTEIVLVGQYIWMLRGSLRRLPWEQIFLRPLVASVTMGAVALLLRTWLPLLAIVPIAGISYLGALLALGVLGKDELRFLRTMRDGRREVRDVVMPQ